MSFDWLQERDLLGGEESLFFMIYITPSFGKADSESIESPSPASIRYSR
jgi:hypothetical protein